MPASHKNIDPNCASIPQKLNESIEKEDDYYLEEDIYCGNLHLGPPSTYSLGSAGASHAGAMSRKRTISDDEHNRSPAGSKRTKIFLKSKAFFQQATCFVLPEVVWANIFSLLHPADLGRHRRTCKIFKRYLDDENIWRRSRKIYLPDHPKPVFGLAEWEMLSIMLGNCCMLCERDTLGRKRCEAPSIKVTKASIYWPFRVRCCKACLEGNTTKESSLLSSAFPVVLLTALPFGIVDLRNNWTSNSTHYQPGIGLTKIFWNADIQGILKRYQEANDMKVQEEWLKSLEDEGMAHRIDIIRIEKFENLRTKETDSLSARKEMDCARLGQLQKDLSQKERTTKHGNIQVEDQCQEGPDLYQSPGANIENCPVKGSSIVGMELKTNLPFCEPEGVDGAKNCSGRFGSAQISNSVQVQHTAHEVAEVKSRRRADIEARCLQMRPCWTPESLARLPVFQAAINIALPLTEHSCEELEFKLKQISTEDQQETCGGAGPLKIRQDRKILLDQKQKEAKERKEAQWDELQVPVRARLIVYADEIIRSWIGFITKGTASKFAFNVLSHCRRRFYEDTPYSVDDLYRLNSLDTTTRIGKGTLEVPTTRRLTIENMKFVFDNKIRPYTDRFGKELFSCSECEYNPRFYAFDGSIQHYAAKHTSQLSSGSVVVHWRTDWPAKLPFKIDHSSQTNNQRQLYPSLLAPMGIFAPVSVDLHTSHAAYNFSNYSGYNYTPQTQQVHQGVTPSKLINQTHHVYLEQVAQDSRVAWFQLSGIKDLPSSVRVHYVITKIMPSFRKKFSFEPSLALLVGVLEGYHTLKPIGDANDLLCLECYKKTKPPFTAGNTGVRRLLTFSALLQHFETIHILRNRGVVKPDWKTEMLKLPETKVIGTLSQASGMDKEKYNLLKGVFPLAFPLPFHEIYSSNATHGVQPESRTNTTNTDNQGTRLTAQKAIPKTPATTKINSGCIDNDSHQSRDSIFQNSCSGNILHANGNTRQCRSLLKMHDQKLQTYLPHCDDKPTMTAVELFLENFLRNTGDSTQSDIKKDEDKILHTSVVVIENALLDPHQQVDKEDVLQHGQPSLQITPSKIRKRNRPLPLRNDGKLIPRYARSKSPNNRTMFKFHETAPHRISHPTHSSTASYHAVEKTYSYHDINDHKFPRQEPIYLKEPYSEPPYPKESNKYYDTGYSLPARVSPALLLPPTVPPPLPSDYYALKDYKKNYRGTDWSRIPPLVYPVPPLPSTILPGGCYVTRYELDYMGPGRPKDPPPPLQSAQTQYYSCPPLRPSVTDSAYRRRSRSPEVVNGHSYGDITPPNKFGSTSLHRGSITSVQQYKSSEWDGDRGYHQSYRSTSDTRK